VGAVLLVGLTMVFLIFLILYGVFNLMGYLLTRKPASKTVVTGPTIKILEDEESVAAIAAVLSVIMESKFVVKSVRRVVDDRFVIWRKTGWRGVRRWRAGSKWS